MIKFVDNDKNKVLEFDTWEKLSIFLIRKLKKIRKTTKAIKKFYGEGMEREDYEDNDEDDYSCDDCTGEYCDECCGGDCYEEA